MSMLMCYKGMYRWNAYICIYFSLSWLLLMQYFDSGSYKLSPTSEPVNTAYVSFCPRAFSLRGLSSCKFLLVTTIFPKSFIKSIIHIFLCFVLCSFIFQAPISIDLCNCHFELYIRLWHWRSWANSSFSWSSLCSHHRHCMVCFIHVFHRL